MTCEAARANGGDCVDIWRIRLSKDHPRPESHRARERILRRYLDLPDEQALLFEPDSGGKPCVAIPRGTTIQFNLSHSHGLALLAVSQSRPVGVDVERLRPVRDPLRIAQRVWPEHQFSALLETPPHQLRERFFIGWTRFEATQKAAGRGLFAPPAACHRMQVMSFSPAPGYVACIAVETDSSVQLRHLDDADA